ncbi:unnamed protein product [Cylindrotheca closterium]|uniref:Uncharacterized protein n=1 Tax=Cylindrotheca closterium TaxID=2856 RepID=A0AAD2PX89_9STRA|nr:unnamed protein product [Cylindrotheca closterium]
MDEPPINHLVTPLEMMEPGLALKGYSERVSPCTAVWVHTDMQILTLQAQGSREEYLTLTSLDWTTVQSTKVPNQR